MIGKKVTFLPKWRHFREADFTSGFQIHNIKLDLVSYHKQLCYMPNKEIYKNKILNDQWSLSTRIYVLLFISVMPNFSAYE